MRLKLIKFLTLAFISTSAFAFELHPRSVCGLEDERTPSANPSVAKLVRNSTTKAGCTATLIGNSCMISAGHCTNSMHLVQFDLRDDQSVDPRDMYTVDRKTIKYTHTGAGNDYAVFKVHPNSVTGHLPGKTRRALRVRFDYVDQGSTVRITGYGKSQNKERSFSQQTHTDVLTWTSDRIISYRADTDGGNSGSAVVLERTNEIIGVHTNGGCHAFGGTNFGTSIAGNQTFSQLIEECLASDL
jgi:V8-like Glu-specific endopeptidase